jgi:hypothetical protein
MEMHMLFTNSIDSFHVCTTCGYLFQNLPENEQPQRCNCQHDSDVPRWRGYDFNEHAALCRCCGTTVLSSGSRWSVWFCDACLHDVQELHNRLGATVIPVARHSLLNGISVASKDVNDDRAIGDFLNAFHNLILGEKRLSQWHERRVINLIEKLELATKPSVQLHTYLACAKELAAQDSRYSQGSAFDALCAAFGVSSIQRPGPSLVTTIPVGDQS